jgi:hypothetical protein
LKGFLPSQYSGVVLGKTGISSSSNTVKFSSGTLQPGLVFFRRLFITDSIPLVVIGLFWFPMSSFW